MNEDFMSASIDDDLFDDESIQGGNSRTVVEPIRPTGVMDDGNVLGMVDPNPEPTPEVKKTAGKADDSDIIKSLNELVAPVPEDLKVDDNDDVVYAMLKKGGINPNAIEIIDEDGKPILASFNDLTKEEQMDILSTVVTPASSINNEEAPDLEDDEVDLLNTIRNNNMGVEEFIAAIKEKAISEYLSSGAGEQYYSVDELSDDDLYMSDYHSKVPSATEEEVAAALEAAKMNPQVFDRTIKGMRETYRNQEAAIQQQEAAKEEARIEQQQKEYESMVVSAVDKMDSFTIGEIDINLSVEDKEQIASAILDKDVTGTRYLAQMLNNPETLSEMVWFALKGKEGITQMQRYYKKEIAEKQSSAYKKGFEDAKTGKNMSYTVARPKGSTQRGGQQFRSVASLEDIDGGID